MLFKAQLDSQYSIDYDRRLIDIDINNDPYQITTKHGMYLFLLDLRDDIFVTLEDGDNVGTLKHSDYLKIKSLLSTAEINYCEKLLAYIKENILIPNCRITK